MKYKFCGVHWFELAECWGLDIEGLDEEEQEEIVMHYIMEKTSSVPALCLRDKVRKEVSKKNKTITDMRSFLEKFMLNQKKFGHMYKLYEGLYKTKDYFMFTYYFLLLFQHLRVDEV